MTDLPLPTNISPQRAQRLQRLYKATTSSPTENVNPTTANIDQISVEEQLTLINQADATVTTAVQQAIPQLVPLLEAMVKRFREHPETARLIYVGAGTSGRLGVLDAVECVPTFGTPPGQIIGIIAGGKEALTEAVEGAEDDGKQAKKDLAALNLTPADTVIGVSASGGAEYAIQALAMAKQAGCLTGAITNNPNAKLLGAGKHAVVIETGPEVITGSTRMKAGTAQKLVLNMISTTLMVNLGRTYGNVMVDVQPTNAKLRQRAERLVSALAEVPAEKAKAVLEQTRYQVKTAVAMLINGWDLNKAKEQLQAANGHLCSCIDN